MDIGIEDREPSDMDPEEAVEAVEQEFECIERTPEESERLGVSVAYLASAFLSELESCFGEEADPHYHDINKRMLFGADARGSAFCCPRDGLPGCSFVDALPAEHTGPATVMLSWSWSYRARTVVSALERWCEQTDRDPTNTFVWQCALCCNQFRVEEKKASGESEPFELFEAAFESKIRTTMHVLALLDPWDSPLYIGRIWCIFELWKAMNTEGCTLDVILPEEEEQRFKDALRSNGMQAMYKAFEKLRIQDAKASVETDRTNILRLVDPDAEGDDELDYSERCATLNREVRQRLMAWCVDTAAEHAEAQIHRGDALGRTGLQAGNLLIGAADFERADAILKAAMESLEAVGAENAMDYFVLLRRRADVANHQGKHDEAESLIGRVLRGFESDPESTMPDRIKGALSRRFEYPRALTVAGETANLRGHLAPAVELFRRARVSFEVVDAVGTTAHTWLLMKLASCLCRQGKHDESEEVLRLCTSVTDTDGCLTPEDGEVRKILGRCRLGQGRYAEAWDLFATAKEFLVDASADASASYGALLILMGACQFEQEAYADASSLFDEAVSLYERIGATDRLDYQTIAFYYGRIHLAEGRMEDAMDRFEEAREAFESVDAVSTPEYGRVLLVMGKCQLLMGFNDAAIAFLNDARTAFEVSDAAGAFAHLALLGA